MYVHKFRHKSVVVATLLGLSVGSTISALADDLESRIEQLNQRISFGVKQGSIKPRQANELRQNLSDIRQAAAARRAKAELKPTDLSGLDSQLNQQSNLIRSYNQAGARKVARKDASGPAWVAGEDGAQNARQLKRQMKTQEMRQRRQFDQANMQVREQQQQAYEKEMLQKLGSQRPEILKNKEDIDRIRQSTGAN